MTADPSEVNMHLYRKSTAFICAVLVASALMTSVAHAAEGDPITGRLTEGSVFSIDLGLWTMLQGFAVPIIVGILTKALAKSNVKVAVSLIVNGIGALISSAVVTDAAYFSKATLLTWALGLIATIAVHYGVWRPLDVTGSVPEQNKLAPSFGLG